MKLNGWTIFGFGLFALVAFGGAWLALFLVALDHDGSAYGDLGYLDSTRTFRGPGPYLVHQAGFGRRDVLIVRGVGEHDPGAQNPDYALIILGARNFGTKDRDPDGIFRMGDFKAYSLPCGVIDRLARRGIAVNPRARRFILGHCQPVK